MPDHLEFLVGELRLERQNEPGRCLAGRVRHDVQLDRLSSVAHVRRLAGNYTRRMVARELPVSLAEIEAAAGRIAGQAVHTPLLRLPLDGEVYVKPESLQRTGSFKFRGAYNALASTTRERIERGVVADSSGNHAQGVAAAAALLGVPATIVMPENAAQVKVERTAGWGAEIVRCGNSTDERQRVAGEIRDARGFEYIPPFDDARIVAGQGTVGLELVHDLPDVETVVVCIGGGGLISGVATAVKALRPSARVIGVEPELAADAQQSLREGRIVRWSAENVTRTICDGVRTQSLGELTFAAISTLVDEIVTVTEEDVLAAMRYALLEAKLLLEPTGALTLAALLSGAVQAVGPTVLVASGGNADPALIASLLA
jgi:threonine dehydratase